jgi:hypothetical protein
MWGYNVSAVYNDTGMSSMTASGVAGEMSSDHPGSSGWLDYQGYAAGESNVRDVIVSLGTNDVLQGATENTIETSLSAIVANIQSWSRTDDPDTSVNVFVTTIPPLGLPVGDSREGTVRKNVNAWILGGAGGAGVANLPPTAVPLDIASAVQDPSDIHNINPAYLSGGIPTSAYYQKLAAAAANGIATWMTSGHPPLTIW